MKTLHDLLVHQTFMGPVWTLLLAFVAVPIANELVSKYRGTRAASILQAIALGLLKTPGVGRVLARFPVVGELLYVFAPQDKTGLPQPRFISAKTEDGEQLVPPPGPPVAVLLILALAPALPACATWQEITRLSLTSLERSHAEAAEAARLYDKQKQADFRERSTKVKTSAELEALVAEHEAYKVKFAKVVDGFNKAWAVIAQAKATLPLIVRGASASERDKITGWITEGLAFLLQGKETLSVFGVQIGGGAP